MNLYGYVQNDPISSVDPLGLADDPFSFVDEAYNRSIIGGRTGRVLAEKAPGIIQDQFRSGISEIGMAMMPFDKALAWIRGAAPVELASRLGSGHAFTKHVLTRGEFAGLGIRTTKQFEVHIANVLKNPTTKCNLKGGRTAYWHEETSTFIVTDPRSKDFGTVFQPVEGRAYFDRLRITQGVP